LPKLRAEANSPPWDKEGWLRPLRKYREATLSGVDGVVRSREIVLELERTTPSAPFKGTGIFLDGASTPPLPRRGVRFHGCDKFRVGDYPTQSNAYTSQVYDRRHSGILTVHF